MAQQNSRNSPHLSSTHLQNGSAPSSPSMSNTANQGGNQRQPQPVSYPSPTSYPSPSLSSAQYNYPAPGQQGQQEAYRASPTGSNGSLNLPSMRSLDPMQQQPQGHHQMASNLPPVAQMQGGPYYHNPGQSLPHPSYPNVTSDPTGQNMRYALPHTDNGRVMSGGRHKKEIKRRTKTGCLTCRKRRIKCDEQHPACRNCQKSKRECLGYDPIFKQTPGPAAIQPAPQNMPPPNPYGQQPQMVYNNGGQVGVYDPALSAGGSPASQNYDFTSAIDPALEAAAPTTANAASNAGATYTTPAKRTVSDLLAVGGPALPTSPITNTTVIDEIAQVYQTMYASALQEFLESRWFALKGWHKLKSDVPLLEAFAALLHQFTKQASNSAPEEGKIAFAAEGRTVWALASMTRGAVAELNGHSTHRTVPPNDDPVEAANRLNVFETLLTGRVAAGNSLTAPVPLSTDHHRLRELEFWHTLSNFVTLNYEDSGPAATKAVDDNLAALRNLLDGRENRDVLYSIAVVRGLGQRVSEYTDSDQPLHLDESDNKSKLLVAKKFISDEASGNGTTNVIRRFCELAARSWGVPAGAPSPPAAAK